ncbi:MAG: hypothetical protein HY720_11855 [Planctomycetes bacterium]|nr:hypothetical protein [Planctomycetota bacterium]
MGRKVAVVGIGQTENKSHWDLTLPALYRLAAKRAVADARLDLGKIDAIVFGNSPEYFEGVNAPEKWCAEAIGGYGKPVFRVHTGGTVGGSTAIAAYYLVASGAFDRVLAISGNKLGDCAHAQLGLSTCYDPILGRSFAAGAIGAVAIQSSGYMAAYGVTEEHAAKVAVKNRTNALRNPYAHIRIPGYSMEIAMKSPMLSSPLKLSDCCPQSDSACAMVFAPEEMAKDLTDTPAWVLAAVGVNEGVNYAGRRWYQPIGLRKAAELAYERAGIRDPRRELSVIEVYDAFTYQEMIWYEGLGLCDWGEGKRLIDEGTTRMDGPLPVNPSGGVLCANSIGASAMIRKAEAALQVQGKAGERQVPGARLSLGHGWGGAIQFHTIMIFSKEKP